MIKRIADWLLKLLCYPKYHRDIRGDLEEIHNKRKKRGRIVADLMYLKEVISLMRPSVVKPFRFTFFNSSLGIVRNYIVIAIRQMLRNKVHAAINISGLAIGLACCLLISLYILDELSFDKFHHNADRIYRINSHSSIGGNERQWALSPSSLAPALLETLPQVESIARIGTIGKSSQFVKYNEVVYDESSGYGPYGKAFFIDSTFFEVFTYKPLAGSLEIASKKPQSAIITRRIAEKIFGERQVIGESLEFANLGKYEITAVIGDPPGNAHFQFDYLLTNEFDTESPRNFFWARSYVLMHNGAGLDGIVKKIDSIGLATEPGLEKNGIYMSYELQPVTDIHLNAGYEYELYPANDIRYVYILSIVSVFILLIATINFINLSTAQLTRRSREFGIRNVIGAGRGQIMLQFFIQSLSTTMIAAIIGILISIFALDVFNQFTGKQLSLSSIATWQGLSVVALMLGAISFVTGLYPLAITNSATPISMLKEELKPGSTTDFLRKVMVVFQFGISVTLMAATFIIIQQLHFLQNEDLGFNTDQILLLSVDGKVPVNRLNAIKHGVQQVSSVQWATLHSGGPGKHTNVMVMVPEGFDDKTTHRIDGIYADFDFVKTYGFKLIAGRDFNPALPTDSLNFILNRSAVRKFGWEVEEAVGRKINYPSGGPARGPAKGGTVIGVTEDFHYASLHNEIGPFMIGIHSSNFRGLGFSFLSVKTHSSNIKETLTRIGSVWDDLEPNRPINYSFLDQSYANQYRSEEKLSQTISIFAGLAIFIACLGLLGLVLFVTQEKTKEIGIRKVLGASLPQIIVLLTTGFFKLILIGNIIAWPVTYIFLKDWLEGFAYHVDINLLVFVFAGISTVIIAALTIGYQTLVAALSNPVNSLRYE